MWDKFKVLPVRTRQLMTLGVVLAFVVALPLFVWAIITQRFDIRKGASSGEQVYSLGTLPTADIQMYMPSKTVNFGTFYTAYAPLSYAGQIVTNQADFTYTWKLSTTNYIKITPIEACADNIQAPCPKDHVNIKVIKTGTTQLKLEVKQISTKLIVASTTFTVKVNPTPKVPPSSCGQACDPTQTVAGQPGMCPTDMVCVAGGQSSTTKKSNSKLTGVCRKATCPDSEDCTCLDQTVVNECEACGADKKACASGLTCKYPTPPLGYQQPSTVGVCVKPDGTSTCDPDKGITPTISTSCPKTAKPLATFTWTNNPNPTFGFNVEISADATFSAVYVKNIKTGKTTDSSNFKGASASNKGQLLVLQPAKNYYVRVFNGSEGASAVFQVDYCIPCTKEGKTLNTSTPGYKCCENLTPISTIKPDSKKMCPANTNTTLSVCTKLGDGKCGTGENVCNAPGDCGGKVSYLFKLRVKFEGVSDGSADGATVALRFVQKGSPNTLGYSTDPINVYYVSDSDGIYEATFNLNNKSLAPGNNYNVYVKGEKDIAEKFCRSNGQSGRCKLVDDGKVSITSTTKEQDLDFTGLPLEPGDLYPQDGQVDMQDFAKITDRMNKLSTDLTDEDKKTADLNYDGTVNGLDAGLLLHTLQTRYEEN